MSSNYPPGVTGNEDHITGMCELPVTVVVTFTVKVRIDGEGKRAGDAIAEDAIEKALDIVRTTIDAPEVDVDTAFE